MSPALWKPTPLFARPATAFAVAGPIARKARDLQEARTRAGAATVAFTTPLVATQRPVKHRAA